MRSKEEAHDYRYFPDPDLLPLEFTDDWVAAIKNSLPELPDEKRNRFVSAYGLSVYDASVLSAERASSDFFEATAKGRDGKIAANWVINELFGRLNKEGKTIETTPVSALQLGEIVDLITSGTISGKIAKDVFEIVWTEGGSPSEIVESRGLKQVTDTRRHRKGRGRDNCPESRQNRRCFGQTLHAGLVCGPGHEIHRRQGKSPGR